MDHSDELAQELNLLKLRDQVESRSYYESTSSLNDQPNAVGNFYAVYESPSTSSSSVNTQQQYNRGRRGRGFIRGQNSRGRPFRRNPSQDRSRSVAQQGSRSINDYRAVIPFETSSSSHLITHRGLRSKRYFGVPQKNKPSNEFSQRYSPTRERNRSSFRRRSEMEDDFRSRMIKRNPLRDRSRAVIPFGTSSPSHLTTQQDFRSKRDFGFPHKTNPSNELKKQDSSSHQCGRAGFHRRSEMGDDFPFRKEKRVYPMAYKILEEMVSDESLDNSIILMDLTTDSSGFALRLSNMNMGFVRLVLKLFKKLCSDDQPSPDLYLLLCMLVDNNFHFKMMEFLMECTTKPFNKQQASVHFSNSLWLMRAWMKYTSNAAFVAVGSLLPFVKTAVADHDLLAEEDISQSLAEVEELYEGKMKPKPLRVDPDLLFKMHDEDPPDDFRQISVFPTKDDIHEKNPFVRSNLTNSAYVSTDHYLDVQFRLLREDFVRPLREGIHQFHQNTGRIKRKYDGVKIYHDVMIKFPKLSQQGVSYRLQFDVCRLKHVQWQSSKRLIFGNLVCLSNDNFQNNFLFASITKREVEDLDKGYIDVEFWKTDNGEEEDDEDLLGSDEEVDEEFEQLRRHREAVDSSSLISTSDMKKTYSMAESEAYFEAYRHVLAGLQETHDIPLGQYIVKCRKERDSPRYLRGLGRTATYDFSCIVKDEVDSSLNLTYDVLDVDRWPSPEQLGLDPSQIHALKSALTNELSIIQGPPGTGKTYVGLMIMKILLHNRMSDTPGHALDSNLKNVPNAPILLVCYTNHALDQFLEGIARFHPNGLVRVGGRGKVESLKKYSLHLLRRNFDSTKSSRTTYFHLQTDLEKQIQEVEEIQEIMEASTDSILLLSVLEPVISEVHYDQLKSQRYVKDKDSLLNWLGVSKRVYSVPENSFIVQEPLEALVRHYAHYGISREQVFHAVNCTGRISPEELHHCLYDHDHYYDPDPDINPDLICDHLANLEFPPHSHLSKYFHRLIFSLEIRCAFFVLLLQYKDINMVTPQMIEGWINQKRQEAEKNDAENNFEVANLEEEDDLVKNQRILDEDLMFMHVDKKVQKPKWQRPKKNVSSAKMDELFFNTDEDDLNDGFQYQGHERKKRKQNLFKKMKREMTKQDSMTKTEAENIFNIFYLKSAEKWRLYRYWVKTLLAQKRKVRNERAEKYNRLVKKRTDLRNRDSFEILKKADVIAMTTTGAAKYRDMIYKLPVRIMIVEEAAEVLEAHIVTSMPQTTQHLILIGDHQQLKPSPTVYELALKYKLDISLFERMVKNELPCSRLELQHRMRPRIADLIRPHIYKNLRDHDSVKLYEDVKGVQSNVFFLSHDHLEDNVMDSKSKVNQHEADFMIGLCRYLLLQGYEPDQITILTAYVGQVIAFKKALKMKLNNRVRITAVDNYQGEENDIILLSLVRSNEEGKIGFLSIENRVCVALSRAKKGLYCIGNFELLKEKSDLWSNILDQLDRDNLLGEELPLQCQTHQTMKSVKCSEDFKKLPGGGCGQPCGARLDCGHVCPSLCHPNDQEHQKIKCPKPMENVCSKGHKTNLKCSEKLKCKHPVELFIPKCGRTIEIKCYQDPEEVICTEPCPKNLRYGHQCTNMCGLDCIKVTECKAEVEKLLRCGHCNKYACSKLYEVDISDCTQRCKQLLKCGHVCAGTCGKCAQGRLHIGCFNSKCNRVLYCGHLCPGTCNAVCSPCQHKCETRCQHRVCEKPCSVPCELCKIKCDWKCEHYECTKLCSEPCDRPPCNQPCKEILRCGHPCIGLCGEPCPSLCRVCDINDVEKLFFGNKYDENARFVQLECKHIFSYECLDTWMQQENNDESSEIDIKLKECPRCKTPIRRSTRYGNIVNKTLIMINEVREKISSTLKDFEICGENLLKTFSEDRKTTMKYRSEMRTLTKAVKSPATNTTLVLSETKYSCLAEFTEISDKLRYERITSNASLNSLELKMAQVVAWLMSKCNLLSEQEKEDLECERQRCKDILELIQMKNKVERRTDVKMEDIDIYVQEIQNLTITDIFPYSYEKQEQVDDAFDNISNLFPELVFGLGIRDDERKMIVPAINLSRDHWFKCRNGHVYCIDECDGLLEESKCPECKADIDATSHELNPADRVAAEMEEDTDSDPNEFEIAEDLCT